MVGLTLTLVITAAIAVTAVLWISGIDYMKNNHPDYKGEDLFNEEEENEQD